MTAAHTGAITIELAGPGGEPIDFERTTRSHGLTTVAPFSVSDDGRCLAVVVRLGSGTPRCVELTVSSEARATDEPPLLCNARVGGKPLTRTEEGELRRVLAIMLALDSDLKPFYDAVVDDPLLSWARSGAGRMVRSQTVFEDVIRTICTTNCAFSGTRRMLTTMIAELGECAAPLANGETPADPAAGRAFPTPAAIAAAGAGFLREQARLGYRAEYVESIAQRVASGDLDLESLRPDVPEPLDDERAREKLLELPGIGPYGAAHAMMLIGRYSMPILDSWSRPTYAEIVGRKTSDRVIQRRFNRFGPYAGLAFWLVVTRGWVPAPGSTV